MSKIKKLSINEAKKIAAGEVVERPSNIVKELVENSIDAGSKNISIYIQDGGKKLIRVVDDGFGMSEEDAKLCFEHHATSKITKVDDLDKIYTYGFRGEALSTISSISKIALITKEEDVQFGIKLLLEDGQIISEEKVSASRGTDIKVENIFYNVPARQKFLKKSETEWRNISQLFQSYCFAYKNIHFKLFNDDNIIFNCPTVKNIKERIVQVWNLSLSESCIKIEDENQKYNFSIEGYISNHQVHQFNRNRIYLFVNNRWIKNIELSRSLLQGYQHVLPSGRFPVAVILIKVDPKNVDINVHPRKEEVRLLHSYQIEQALQLSVKVALERNLSKQLNKNVKISGAKILPFEQSLQLYAETDFGQDYDNLITPARQSDFSRDTLIRVEQPFAAEFNLSNNLNKLEIEELFGSRISSRESSSEQLNVSKKESRFKFLGQVKKTYLLMESEEGLLVVDQHAAHESVLFDLFTKRFDTVSTVKLVFPHIINLQESELDTVIEYLPILKKYGIESERLGAAQLVITATPVHLKDASLDDLLSQVVSWINEFENLDNKDLESELSKKLCAQMACKASIKAGDDVSELQVDQLMKDLYNVENRFTCPHGRPTFWTLSTNEIEKKFKRDYKS